jgi:predicted phosphohydrolase
MADSHGDHEKVEVPDGDVFIHAGDFCATGSANDVVRFNQWLGTLPHEFKIVVAGNHDLILENDPYIGQFLFTNALYLENQEVYLSEFGLTVWGSPITPSFNNWAFNRKRGKEIAECWKKIPPYVDVVITHGPPSGILDLDPDHAHVGCRDLWHRINKIQPKLHIFGHLHNSYGLYNQLPNKVLDFDTLFGNCSVMNDNYEVTNPPLVIDL